MYRVRILIAVVFLILASQVTNAQKRNKTAKISTFELGKTDFLLNGKPFQIRSGEIQPDRVPKEYWRNRIQMAKAMGLNTIACYLFWNYHETEEGVYDFKTENRDIAEFFKIAQEEGMFVFLRPGPYACGEYDFGGLPIYLLKYPDIKIRCMDPRYTQAVEKYFTKLAEIIKPYQISQGGPILMLQIENEYGSYGNDRNYMKWLAELWTKNGITVPFSTGDGATPYMLEAGSLPGCASGLDSGSELSDFELAQKMNPGVPVFSSETYPGWLTHWGEKWANVKIESICKELDFLMQNKKSFNLYVFHGGTNFGFAAGANSDRVDGAKSGLGQSFMPDVTSYDYDSPLTEQGRVTPKYLEMRKTIQRYLPKSEKIPAIPEEITSIAIPEFQMEKYTSLWDNMPQAINLVQPKPMEYLDQYQGMILYRTKLIGNKEGKLIIRDLHDFAIVFVDGKLVGTIDRSKNENSIVLPKSSSEYPVLEIMVEAMGHINFAEFMIDRKGITDRVVLKAMTLMNWEVFQFPLKENWVSSLVKTNNKMDRPLVFFKGVFNLETVADTYLDLTNYKKGYVWVNGHNLGRFWEIGPQKRLYCPAGWLKQGKNEIRVLDLLQTDPAGITGFEKPE